MATEDEFFGLIVAFDDKSKVCKRMVPQSTKQVAARTKRHRPAWLVASLIMAACGSGNDSSDACGASGSTGAVDGDKHTNVSPAVLSAMLAAKDFPLVNVHIPYEGEIRGTDLFIPYNAIEQDLDELPADKRAKIALYCRTGRMSDMAARALVALGYTNVWNLDGGMIAWEEAGYQLVNLGR